MGEPPSGPWAKWYRGVVRKGLAGASLVVAPSQWMLRSMEECYGRQRQSRVIYNGRTPAWFDPMARKENYAASAGRLWDEGKQLRLLMEMERPPLPIRVAGATALAGERARENPKARAGRAVCGRTFRRRDAGAAEPGCDLHCDIEVRAVRVGAAGGRAVALRDCGQRYSQPARGVGGRGAVLPQG